MLRLSEAQFFIKGQVGEDEGPLRAQGLRPPEGLRQKGGGQIPQRMVRIVQDFRVKGVVFRQRGTKSVVEEG